MDLMDMVLSFDETQQPMLMAYLEAVHNEYREAVFDGKRNFNHVFFARFNLNRHLVVFFQETGNHLPVQKDSAARFL